MKNLEKIERYFELIYAEVVTTKNEVAQLNSRMSNVERGIGDLRADNRAIRADLKALRRERADS